jgi:hypothetical protein
MAYVRPGRAYDLDWMDAFLGGLALPHDVRPLPRTLKESFGITPPTWRNRLAARIAGRSAAADRAAALAATPSLDLVCGDATLTCTCSRAPHVAVEAQELSDMDGLDMAGITTRFEFYGHDPGLVFLDTYTKIMDALHDSGHFVLYSGQTGVWERSPA